MRKVILLLSVLIYQNCIFAQESQLPNQITLWNPSDLRFTSDNKYLVAVSPNDSKIWNLENLECINITPDFYKDVNTLDNSWAYLPDNNSFFFHNTVPANEIYSINAGGKTKTLTGTLGEGKYKDFQFDNPPSFFLTSDIMLTIRSDRKYLPYISVEKAGLPKPLFTSKIEGKNTINTGNRFFSVLKGDADIYYLLSFRSAAYSNNAEGVITEINLATQKTRVLAGGIMITVGDNSNTPVYIERLKLSTETPGFIILNLSGLIYAVRKSDGKILPNADIVSSFPENTYPAICGERDGKLIIRYYDLGTNQGIIFGTYDFDTHKIIEQVMHFGIDIYNVKEYRFAVSRDGKEFAIAYKWDKDLGFKVAYLDTEKMTMLRDRENIVEDFLKKMKEIQEANEIARANKIKELQSKPREEIIARAWYAVIDKDNNRTGFGFKFEIDSNGNVTGYYEYRYTPSEMEKPSGLHTYYYDAKFDVSGRFTADNILTINIINTKFINEHLDESAFINKTLTFQISINQTYDGYMLYCKEYGGYFLDGSIYSNYF